MSKTNLTIEDIFKSLDDWREERGLQKTVGNIAANIGEEIVEYLRAKNDEQRIDALCDMFVFRVNASCALNANPILFDWDRHCLGNPFNMLVLDFSQIVDNFHEVEQCYILLSIARYAKTGVKLLGYDFLIAMDETLKEIHSRKGAWNEATGKWEKFKTEEAMALWYKANYSKAKVA